VLQQCLTMPPWYLIHVLIYILLKKKEIRRYIICLILLVSNAKFASGLIETAGSRSEMSSLISPIQTHMCYWHSRVKTARLLLTWCAQRWSTVKDTYICQRGSLNSQQKLIFKKSSCYQIQQGVYILQCIHQQGIENSWCTYPSGVALGTQGLSNL
jgi:hypothetical protein